MESSSGLNKLLRRTDIWRGRRADHLGAVRATGFAGLDRILVGGGWPLGGLVEVSYPQPGSGEWHLLSGALQHSAGGRGYLVLVNPPALPCAAALAQLGVPLERLLVVRCANKAELLVAVLETLCCDCAQMLLFWEARQSLSYAEWRKVQLAAANTGALCVALRPGRQPGHSPAVLRLALQAGVEGPLLTIHRQRGGPAGGEFRLSWPAGWALQPFDPALTHQPPQSAGRVLPLQA